MAQIVRKLAKVIAGFTFVVSVFLTSGVLGFNFSLAFSMRNVAQMFFIIFFALLLHSLFGNVGKEKGLETDVYKMAQADYEATVSRVNGAEEMEHIGKFCTKWIENKLRENRTKVLLSVNLTYADYEASDYTFKSAVRNWLHIFRSRLGDRHMERSQIRAIIKAHRMKPVIFTPSMLLTCGDEDDDKGWMIHPKNAMLKRSIKDLIPTVIAAVICVGLTDIALSGSLTTETILRFFYAIYVFSFVSIKGFISKFKNISVDTVEYRKAQSARLREYMASKFRPEEFKHFNDQTVKESD